MTGKRVCKSIIQSVYFNHSNGKSVKEIAHLYSLNRRTVYNIINRAEKEGRLEHKTPTGRPVKLTGENECKILKIICDNPHASTRRLALEIKSYCGLNVSHESVRKVLLKHKYSSRVLKKERMLTQENIESRLQFAMKHISLPIEYWNNVIFCGETQLLLNYRGASQNICLKNITDLEHGSTTSSLNLRGLSIIAWCCVSSKGIGEIRLFDEIITKDNYLDILKDDLKASVLKFGFVDPEEADKLKYYKICECCGPEHESYLCRHWLLYNYSNVIDTPALSSDINPIAILWDYLKKKMDDRSPRNKHELLQFIKDEWSRISEEYDIQKLIHSMRDRMRAVVEAKGGQPT